MGRILSNLHTHTLFSDGHDKAEDYILAALEKGFVSLGFSEHCYTPYDAACCVKKDDMPLYFQEIKRLKEKYTGQIEIYLGLEGDYYYPTPVEQVDFFIGSAHYVRNEETGEYYTFDHLPEMFDRAVEQVAGGNVQALVEQYYRMIMDLVINQKPDIVGHLDLITKLNRDDCYFDSSSGWYKEITGEAIEVIAASDSIVEVNTGGIYRGYKTCPYPGPALLERLKQAGVPVTISSDAHQVDGLDFWFNEAAELVRQAGYKNIMQMRGGRFVEVAL